MKYASNGVIPLVIDSAALKTNCENCGDIFICIIAGTKTGDIIDHFVIVVGTNKFAIAIIIIATITKTIPDNGNAFKILVNNITISVPIFVSLKIAIYCDAKKIITNRIPNSLNLFPNFCTNSLSLFIDFEPIPYAIPVIIINKANMYVNPDSKYDVSPNN